MGSLRPSAASPFVAATRGFASLGNFGYRCEKWLSKTCVAPILRISQTVLQLLSVRHSLPADVDRLGKGAVTLLASDVRLVVVKSSFVDQQSSTFSGSDKLVGGLCIA